jgi:NAD(P)-dependent dehydrogenase (short-subunit alcohol dehydrogenase family)
MGLAGILFLIQPAGEPEDLGGQMGDMETDFIPVMAFMASDSSKFITGQTISVDGGIMMVR